MITLFFLLAIAWFETLVFAQSPIAIDDDFEFHRPGKGSLSYFYQDEAVDWQPMDALDYLLEPDLEKKRLKIFAYYDAIYQSTPLLQISDLLKLENRQRFVDLDSYRPNFGFNNRPVWYRIRLHYQGSQPTKRIILNVNGYVVDSQYFVVENGNKIINSFRKSFHEPRALRSRFDTENNTTSVLELSSEKRDIELYFMAYTSVVPHLLNVELHSEQNLEKVIKGWLPFQWAYAGAAIALLTYNFGIFLISRQKIYLFYVGFVGTTWLVQAELNGFYFNIYTKNVAVYWSYHYLLFLGIHGSFFVAFAREFLPFRSYPRINKLTKVTQFIVILTAIAYVTAPTSIMIPFSTFMVFSIVPLIIGPAIWLMTKKEKQAYFYVTAFSIYLIGSAFKTLMLHGYLSSITFLDHIMEIGSLSEALLLSITMGDKLRTLNISLRKYVDQVEDIVDEKTREIRSIMRHIQQGIFSILPGVKIHEEYSQHLCTLVDRTDILNADPALLLSEGSTMNDDDVARMRTAIDLSLDSPFEFELNESHLPRDIEMPGRFLEVDWQVIEDENLQTDKLLVTLRDVTEIKKLRGQAEAHEKEITKISEILAVEIERCQRFFDASKKLLSDVQGVLESSKPVDATQLKLIFLCYHTMKGHVRSLGFKDLTNTIHKAENLCSLYQNNLDQLDLDSLMSDYHLITSVLEEYISIFRDKLGRSASNTINLNKDMVAKLLNIFQLLPKEKRSICSNEEHVLHYAYYKALPTVLKECCDKVVKVAVDLGKQEPRFAIDTPSVDIPPQTVELLQNVFIHLLRNSVDHGLESTDVRLSKNKPAQGLITIRSLIEGNMLLLSIGDDGQGLNLKRIKEKALEKGLLAVNDNDPYAIANAIFHSGFSTASQLSDISGRGVGLDAVRTMLEDAGGGIAIIFNASDNIQVDSTAVPFHFRMSLPDDMWVTGFDQQLNVVSH
ncbi:7TM diverse intracellular signaling domain-containing protein [Oligoflexus tunisiensis]|uniref:7TM diverse intracellular signaling domain-containing protein n=1 Tax=Oligoflexus tunisiensis TaxID=708132 RepID=UPI001FE0C962|nr:7TM diverse intracellular signaling domain-containing protein [Oligoflexus tunisiensis]